MNITHQEARSLIHLRSDRGLNVERWAQLRSHLMECEACASYASQISEAEESLRSAMKQKWSAHPLPHNQGIILGTVNLNKWYPSTYLSTRKALVGTTIVLFSLVLWQLGMTNGNQNSRIELKNAVIPTPATVRSESTVNSLNDCAIPSYVVKENDDLDSIASQFSVSKESIISANDLRSENLQYGSHLLIPDCNLTPTGTVFAPTYTITPVLQKAANTPG